MPSNQLTALRFVQADNAIVQMGGSSIPVPSGSLALSPGTQQTTFFVNARVVGPAMVQLVVTDNCGDWPTFVGAGAGVQLPGPGGTPPATLTPTANGPRIYVSGGGVVSGSAVSVIDTVSNSVVTTVPVEGGTTDLALNPAGTRVYQVHSCGAGACTESVNVIDTATNTVIATPLIGGHGQGEGIAVDPTGQRLYVTELGAIQVLDAASGAILGTVTGNYGSPMRIVINAAGTRLYAIDASYNQLLVVDTSNNSVIAAPVPDPDIGRSQALAINHAGTRLYYNVGNAVGMLDTATNRVLSGLIVPYPPGAGLSALALNPDGTRLYASYATSGHVAVVDTATNSTITTISLAGTGAGRLTVDSTGTRVYVGSQTGVVVIDATTNSVLNTIPTGGVRASFIAARWLP